MALPVPAATQWWQDPPPLLRVARRYALLAVAAVLLASVHLRSRPTTLCVLRATTGVPCPFCGGTTAMTDLGAGDVGAAFRASPIAPVMGLMAPLLGVVSPPSWLASRRLRSYVVLAVLLGAEMWQLLRFGLL